MPLYEYECEVCGHRFEVIQKFSDAPITVCPQCSGAVHKLLSSPAIQFKGSGFYLTDYGRSTGKPDSAGKGDKDKTTADGAKADGGKAEGRGSDAVKSDGAKSESGSSSSTEAKSSSSDSSAAKPAASKSE